MGLFDRFRRPPSDTEIPLPKQVSQLVKATDALRKHYGADGGFALAGAAVGDIGEHEACKAFGLVGARKGNAGYDAIAPDGRTVQVKSTQGGGARFSYHHTGAQHLICIDLDLRGRMGTVIYNGPEAPVRAVLGVEVWNGTASVQRKKLLELNDMVASSERLPRLR